MVVGLILKFKSIKHLSPFQYLVTGVQNRAYKPTHKSVHILKSRDVSNTGEETALQFHVMCVCVYFNHAVKFYFQQRLMVLRTASVSVQMLQ